MVKNHLRNTSLWIERHDQLRSGGTLAGGKGDAVGAVGYQRKSIGAVAFYQGSHIIFDPDACPDRALAIDPAAQELRLMVPGNSSRTRFDPVAVGQVGGRTFGRAVGSAEDAQFHILDRIAHAADPKADEADLRVSRTSAHLQGWQGTKVRRRQRLDHLSIGFAEERHDGP